MNLHKCVVVVLLAALVSLTAFNASAEISQKDFSAAIEKYLATESGQENVYKAIQAYHAKAQAEARKKQEQLAAAKLEEQFKKPIAVEVGNSPFKGPANAKVTIVEFSDFQCPFCSRGKSTVEEILKLYPNDVRVVFKHLPLDFHPEALPAAKASMAAAKQGKFWEMHDHLFENQSKLGADLYIAAAEKLGLDVAKFKADMEAKDVIDQINADMQFAKNNGISGTPYFLVNGVEVRGAYPVEHFKTIIDRWLSQATK